ncbi:MAG: HupE/UreJ family protein [Verrucomicrobiales bacterium]|nr:HupE/UreJ family protein [Verrucomicrobiales bacterium]
MSDSYLRVRVEERELRGEWRLALHDLEVAVGLDGNGDGSITWGELKSRRDAVVTYASAQLRVKAGGAAVPLTFESEMQVDPLANGTYAVLRWRALAAVPVREIDLDYQVFFEGNALHRGLALVERGTESQQLVFSPGTTRGTVVFDGGGSAWGFGGFLREGLWHIWIGYDHVLFLLTLLLPSVLRREGGVWVPAERGRAVGLEVLRVVTAFTVAHSVTLSLGAFGWLTMPGRWVEVGIAGSIAVAALNNLFPVAVGRVWMLAFGFGLVHGLGFATVLVDAGLPPVAKTTALLGFNLGVELGQLAIVAVFLPLAFAARRQAWYAARWLPLGSLATILLALHWMWERWRGMA